MDIKELIIKRASIKGRITKFKNYLDLIKKEPSLTPIEINELTVKLAQSQGLMNTFEDLQTQIEVR